jgi:soluble cytochrome b562
MEDKKMEDSMKENTVEIKVELIGYEELLEKLNNIKKLLQETEVKETKKENYTLDDLKQKLINNLYEKPKYNYNSLDVDLLKILFENNDI